MERILAAATCEHCGAPYEDNSARCRFCNRLRQAGPSVQSDEDPLAPPEPEAIPLGPAWAVRPSYALALARTAGVIWGYARRWSGWEGVAARTVAIPVIAAAAMVIAAWLVVVRALEALVADYNSKGALWLLEAGTASPWVGFVVGAGIVLGGLWAALAFLVR